MSRFPCNRWSSLFSADFVFLHFNIEENPQVPRRDVTLNYVTSAKGHCGSYLQRKPIEYENLSFLFSGELSESRPNYTITAAYIARQRFSQGKKTGEQMVHQQIIRVSIGIPCDETN